MCGCVLGGENHIELPTISGWLQHYWFPTIVDFLCASEPHSISTLHFDICFTYSTRNYEGISFVITTFQFYVKCFDFSSLSCCNSYPSSLSSSSSSLSCTSCNLVLSISSCNAKWLNMKCEGKDIEYVWIFMNINEDVDTTVLSWSNAQFWWNSIWIAASSKSPEYDMNQIYHFAHLQITVISQKIMAY